MGLFDKILKEVGDKVPDLKLDELAKNVSDAVGTLKTEAEKFAEENKDTFEALKTKAEQFAEENKDSIGSVIPNEAEAPKAASGVSWGEEMPDEPNQYNSGMTPIAYFEDIFRTEFAEYELAEEAGWGGPDRSWIIRFRKGGEDKLAVELLPARSEAVKFREKCRKQGLPYLRYYTDYEGWWNTRSYVISRTRAALGE
ncbi:MAG: hypothetical protein J6X24_01855 [Firmicutes bacterium]|nr:hypothetical protein [Bacillota bacterium]